MQRKTFGKKPGGQPGNSGAPRGFASGAETPAAPGAPLPSYASLLGEATGEAHETSPASVVASAPVTVTEADMVHAFGSEWLTMRPVWHQVTSGGLGLSWSFHAFCFNGLWFLYRRQYFWGALVLSITFFLDKLPIVMSIYAVIGLSVLCGFLGRRALVSSTIKRIEKIKQKGGNDGVVATRIASNSGTDMLTPLAYTIATAYIKFSQMPRFGSGSQNPIDVIRALWF